MISREALVDVLRTHCRRRTGPRDMGTHCLCGWKSDAPNGPGQHVQHQADMVLAAIERQQPQRIVYADDLSSDVLWTVQKDAVGNEYLAYEDALDEDERHDR